ncbi:flagellar FlbD family protein [Clostridium senegalense]|uniref:flagellar FlbD family protein n=1 Tax=Clostridium senegalense TaxID=1465809 RepID=UPI0002897AD3|nr:flagellar FlbD family protein [Clostridium senegalense]
MVEVTTLNEKKVIINCDHIEKIESVPDTVITLSNGKVYLVKENRDEVMKKIIEFKRKIFSGNF